MSDTEFTSDPSYVYKRFGFLMIVFGSILGLAIVGGMFYLFANHPPTTDKWLLGALLIGTVGIFLVIMLIGLALISEGFRKFLLDWAHNSGWLFKRFDKTVPKAPAPAEEPPANG